MIERCFGLISAPYDLHMAEMSGGDQRRAGIRTGDRPRVAAAFESAIFSISRSSFTAAMVMMS